MCSHALLGKWYLSCHPRTSVKANMPQNNNPGKWALVPFPSPLRSNFDFVYAIDQGTGTSTLSIWGGLDGCQPTGYSKLMVSG